MTTMQIKARMLLMGMSVFVLSSGSWAQTVDNPFNPLRRSSAQLEATGFSQFASSAGLMPASSIAPELSSAGSYTQTSTTIGLAAAYRLTKDQLDSRPDEGIRLGIELANAEIAYRRILDNYAASRAARTKNLIDSHMLEPQVFVRARILEVNRSHVMDVGSVLNYISRNPAATDRPSFFGRPRNLTYVGNFPADLAAFLNRGITVNLTTQHINAIITAIQEDFQADLVTAPSVVALDSEPVVVFGGSFLPFVYNRSSALVQNQRTQGVDYRDIGIHLYVKPHVISRSEVEATFDALPEGRALKARFRGHNDPSAWQLARTAHIEEILAGQPIHLEIGYRLGAAAKKNMTVQIGEDPSGFGVAFDKDVSFEAGVRASMTKARVKNGHGLVIGGIINETAVDTERKVPVLGDVPVLGAAFRRKIHERRKVETLIFLEAMIVDPAGDPLIHGYHYADRHLPGAPLPEGCRPPFSQVPLAPLEGQPSVHRHYDLKERLLRPATNAAEILK